MIELDPKNNAISNHFDEVEKEVAQLIHGDIERMVNSRLGGLSEEAVKIDGDILKGMRISAVAGKAVDLEDITGEKKIEDAIMDALDYNYTSALERAAQIVASKHPEDEL